MEEIPLSMLAWSLLALIVISCFFSASETAMMAVNRYRLRHLAQSKHQGALRVLRLLDTPERLIGLILICNNFVNILISSLATLMAIRLWGEEYGVMIATGALTVILIIFAEITPKTVAVLNPERIALPSSFILRPLLTLLYPIVWLCGAASNSLLRLFRHSSARKLNSHHLSMEELRTVVNEAGGLIPRRHQKMLTSILDLEKVTVDDIMVPRNEIIGIDIEQPWKAIQDILTSCQHTRLVVYRAEIDQVVGFLHVRDALHLLSHGHLNKDNLLQVVNEAYYVPEGTPLNTQLLKFQRQRYRIGLVVDEYGDIQGLVTLEDILEEIVGEFTTDIAATQKDVHPQSDGSFIIEGTASVRALNRAMGWQLPTDGPKTLNGLITEYLETIPSPGTSFLIAGYPIEIIEVKDNMVGLAKVTPG